ncbi:MAG: hypothetical protein PHR16_17755, partial [Methylovulum sp.]|nr:hypothetical protein [Methylovulum sp.]
DGSIVSGWWLEGGTPAEGRFTRLPRYDITTRPTPYGPISYFSDPHEILRTIYGPWELPDPDFDTVVMAHHLIAFTPLVAAYAYQRLLLALLNDQPSKAARYIETIAPHDPDLAVRLSPLYPVCHNKGKKKGG